MTEKNFHENMDVLVAQLGPFVRAYAKSALRSGGVDLEGAPDNFVLPKQVFTAALQSAAEMWTIRAWKGEVDNIRLCTPIPDDASYSGGTGGEGGE